MRVTGSAHDCSFRAVPEAHRGRRHIVAGALDNLSQRLWSTSASGSGQARPAALDSSASGFGQAALAALDNLSRPRCNVRSMTTHPPAGGPGLPQQRRLVTEIPGPASRALLARRESAVARGVSTILPVYITAAGGGVLVDVDGNSLIDFGSGIAVVSVGNSAPRVAERPSASRSPTFTHTCFMVTPYEGYVAVCEELNGAHRAPRQAFGAVQLGRRGGRERGQDRAARHAAARPSSRSTTPTTAGRT